MDPVGFLERQYCFDEELRPFHTPDWACHSYQSNRLPQTSGHVPVTPQQPVTGGEVILSMIGRGGSALKPLSTGGEGFVSARANQKRIKNKS